MDGTINKSHHFADGKENFGFKSEWGKGVKSSWKSVDMVKILQKLLYSEFSQGILICHVTALLKKMKMGTSAYSIIWVASSLEKLQIAHSGGDLDLRTQNHRATVRIKDLIQD